MIRTSVNATGRGSTASVTPRRCRERVRSWLSDTFAGILSCDRGTSAVEFALIAPILIVALLASADLGGAVSLRMAMDHALRAGAQAAISDPGDAAVLDVLQATASTNMSLGANQTDIGASTVFGATRFCACPEATSVAVACSTICGGSNPTYIYYRLSADRDFTGWIVPSIPMRPALQVQIR